MKKKVPKQIEDFLRLKGDLTMKYLLKAFKPAVQHLSKIAVRAVPCCSHIAPIRQIPETRPPFQFNQSQEKAPASSYATKNTILNIKGIERGSNTVSIQWQDGTSNQYHYAWLRDNCQCVSCRHPIAEERIYDTLSIPLTIQPSTLILNTENVNSSTVGSEHFVEVHWNEQPTNFRKVQPNSRQNNIHVSRYSADFLKLNGIKTKPFMTLNTKANYSENLWDVSAIEKNVPRLSFDYIMQSEFNVLQWLEQIHSFGFCVIEGIPSGPQRVQEVANRISYVRNTFWGDLWSVKSEPMPSNLSMTSQTLFPHTDFGWSESPPGLQFLHCVRFESKQEKGGESTLVDGYYIAEYIKRNHPEVFKALTTVDIEHIFSSKRHYFAFKSPILKQDSESGKICDIRFNQANRSPIQCESIDQVEKTYQALQIFNSAIRDPKHLYEFRLKENEMLIFNNRRLLHGRNGYDGVTTKRHLKGCYLDKEDYESRLQMLRLHFSKDDCSLEGSSVMHIPTSSVVSSIKTNSPLADKKITPSLKKVNAFVNSTSCNLRQPIRSYSVDHNGKTLTAVNRNPIRLASTNSAQTAANDAFEYLMRPENLDPGYDKYDEQFIKNALVNYQADIDSNITYPDKSNLKNVADNQAAFFTKLEDGTKADYIYQCALFDHDIQTNLVNRLVGLLHKLKGKHIALGTGAQIDLFEHSIQCATRAHLDKCDDELAVIALLHDIGEMLSPCNHGEIAGAILRPYVSPEMYWILAHHEVFQGYYYFHHVGGDRHTREIYKTNPNYQATVDFCHLYDQTSFDPNFESYPIEYFMPILKRVLSRKPYWFQPNHPKLGVVTIQKE